MDPSSNPCPICLGPIVQEAYLQSCFHKFCYKCILQWTKVVATKPSSSSSSSSIKCPLCKKESYSIIHGFDGTSFQRHYISNNVRDGFILSKQHKFRLQCYYAEPGKLNEAFSVSRYWKSRKFVQSNQLLQSWLKREIQALVQEEDVDIIVHHIFGVYDSFLKRFCLNSKRVFVLPRYRKTHVEIHETIRDEFRSLMSDAAKSFIQGKTERFVLEMELFLASGLNIEAYDQIYMESIPQKNPAVANDAVEEFQECLALSKYLSKKARTNYLWLFLFQITILMEAVASFSKLLGVEQKKLEQ